MSRMNTNKYKAKEKAKEKAKDNSGNWEYTPYRKLPAETILRDLLSPNSFDPRKVNEIRNPPKSKKQLILEKGDKISKSDKIILDNCVKIENQAIEIDINEIKSLGFGARPKTNEGRKYLLLRNLDIMIHKNNIEGIVNSYLRLNEDDFINIKMFDKEYSEQLEQMNNIVKQEDMIYHMMVTFHTSMPPMNAKGFVKFDAWQLEAIDLIDKNQSIVISAPTSAGKTVALSYAVTKSSEGSSLVVVPTDALAWQTAAYLGNVIGSIVPIITKTYQTKATRDEMIQYINKASIIVGTPESIVDYMPFMKNNFKWIVFDEIHMIGKPEGSMMEQIAKVLKNVPVLALSATIGNIDDLVSWLQKISPLQPVSKIVCDKRFFNLQRYYYDNNNLVSLHPLALISEEEFANGTVIQKNLQPIPPNAWDLAMKIGKEYLGDLEPHRYFNRETRIELTEALEYFNKLIILLVSMYKTNKDYVICILNSYKQESLPALNTDLVSLAFKLKEEHKTPAIFFQKNTIACERMIHEFAQNIEMNEDTKYPRLLRDRLKIAKKVDRVDKKVTTSDDKNSKKELREMLGKTKLKKDGYGVSSVQQTKVEAIIAPPLQEPHEDFILNDAQFFTEGVVENWVGELKQYLPNTGDYYHWLLKLLWRGVGIYAKGLPDPYLRLVQTLACTKQLAIVFSDQSLVFGVNMPFRTSVVIRDPTQIDDMDSMMFHQMAGRAGRRGLDKEGNVVFAGYSWDRIKELSISMIPHIKGTEQVIYTIDHANMLSRNNNRMDWNDTCKNYINNEITEEDATEFRIGMKSNLENAWEFAYNTDDINHLHMNWRLRYSLDCVRISFLLPYFRRAFEGKDHTKELNQILLAHFLSRFICCEEATDMNIMDEPEILLSSPYDMIIAKLNELEIEVPSKVDNKIFLSIQQNSMVEETHSLRQRLLDFRDKLIHIQHYCYHSKISCLSKIMGKLLTRIWWIYHTSSPIMKVFKTYDNIDSEE